VEKSGVTGFMIRDDSTGATTSIAKWRIRSRPSIAIDQLPGVGYPSWEVDLCKVRNGQTGTWQLAWAGERFVDISVGVTVQEAARKTG
jgi:protein ImuA